MIKVTIKSINKNITSKGLQIDLSESGSLKLENDFFILFIFYMFGYL